MKRFFYFAASALLVGLSVPLAHATKADPTNVASTRPNEDEDNDGLTNQEEAEFGTYPYNAYSDADLVMDGEDGWALDPDLHPPRIPNESYAIIKLGDLGVIYPVAFNDNCDILDGNDSTARLWSNGQFTSIPPPPFGWPAGGTGWNGSLSNAGMVTTWTYKTNDRTIYPYSSTAVSTWSPATAFGTLDYYAPGLQDGEHELNNVESSKITAHGTVLGSAAGDVDNADPIQHRQFSAGLRWPLGSSTAAPVGDIITSELNLATNEWETSSGTRVYPKDENANGVTVGYGQVFSNSQSSSGCGVVCKNGTVSFLSTPTSFSNAYSLNNASQPMIVGHTATQSYYWLFRKKCAYRGETG